VYLDIETSDDTERYIQCFNFDLIGGMEDFMLYNFEDRIKNTVIPLIIRYKNYYNETVQCIGGIKIGNDFIYNEKGIIANGNLIVNFGFYKNKKLIDISVKGLTNLLKHNKVKNNKYNRNVINSVIEYKLR